MRDNAPEFSLLQCGADSIEGDPITNMAFSPASHAYAAKQLRQIADDFCQGRMLVMGGGGYNHDNIARAWTAVVDAMVRPD
ncbi:MAG: acetoin utilization protein AcuC [Gammaproteobacteria bacterium]